MGKVLISLCGPNGAGKSTFTKTVLARFDFPVVDPDRYRSQGLSELLAGRLPGRQIHSYLDNGVSFIKESTLSSKFDLKLITLAKGLGYKNILIYLYLSLPEISLQRVARRVCNGGHDIPAETICRRFDKSLANLESVKYIVDYFYLINSSSPHCDVAQIKSLMQLLTVSSYLEDSENDAHS